MSIGSITALVETLVAAGATPELILAAVKTAEAQKDAALEQSREKARNRARNWQSRLDVTPAVWAAVSLAVRKRDGFRCTYCGGSEGIMHCDHIIPLLLGGTSDIENLTTACQACNGGKAGRTVQEWRGEA